MSEFLISILSGIVTSALLFTVGLFWKSNILPWVRSLTYSGLNLTGTWKIMTKGPDVAEIQIRQSAYRVSGLITWNQASEITTYKLDGELHDGLITATFKPNSALPLDRGTLTLLVKNGGKKARGCFAWYDIATSEIIAGDYELELARR